MSAAWVPLIGLLIVGAGAQWCARKVRLGPATEIVQWAVGALAVTCSLGAGAQATRTWIGRDAVPLIVGIHPVVVAAAGLAVIAAVVLAALALVPDRWSSVAAASGVLVLVFLAPSLVRYLPAGSVPDLARSALVAMLQTSDRVTAGWFG
jgi:hypothetical protein